MKARIFSSFLLVFFALVFNAQAAEATALATKGDYELEGKTLYINKKMELLNDSILDAFKKYWTVTPIKFEDEEDIIENYGDKNALILTIVSYNITNSGSYTSRKYLAIAYGASNTGADKTKFDYETFYYASKYKNEVSKMVGGTKVTADSVYNINSDLPFLIKNIQSDVLIKSGKLTPNKIVYKGSNFNYIEPAELNRSLIYIIEENLGKGFNLDAFCTKFEIDQNKIKYINLVKLNELIDAGEEALFILDPIAFEFGIYSTKLCVPVAYIRNKGKIRALQLSYYGVIIIGFWLLFGGYDKLFGGS